MDLLVTTFNRLPTLPSSRAVFDHILDEDPFEGGGGGAGHFDLATDNGDAEGTVGFPPDLHEAAGAPALQTAPHTLTFDLNERKSTF